MVSSRAAEYVTRFSNCSSSEQSALEKIVEYRNECKKMYHDPKSAGMKFNNYPAQKQWQEDMIERIQALGEARDSLQASLSTKTMYSAMPVEKYVEKHVDTVEKKKAPKKNSAEFFFARTKRGLQMRGIKNEHELKYILRFQAIGITGDGSRGYSDYPKMHVEEYMKEQEEMMENLSEYDHEGRQFHMERINALEKVIKYFDNIGEDILQLDNPSYVKYDDRDEISRMFGDH
ncbi:hypothetical protein PBCVCVM1_970R [Paramecium bursaria Chlorella virus CVM-1]|nr:hypothetical protein PBCVCVM1_970R [Paramecium bursaria Chlorella virus CVM-1]